MKLFQKILIANRGEIAVRIINSARKLGIKTVAVYSEVDKEGLHIKKADEAYCIGEQELSETYLNIEKIIEVALRSGADAIHPGYGFLAENHLFVAACDKNDITFIGPNTKAIRLMGNKIEARKFIKEIGIPMTEGITGNPESLLANASKIPFPILVKAAAGGGGKGMRIVRKTEELEAVIETTSREAKNYFGDESIYIEKYVEEPRHIEVQVIGDSFGNVVHLFERECTIQRRYQKIIEESPSPTLTPELREEMGKAAVHISEKVGYNSAGTVEFLVDKDLNFYFLEMNTRIQVEHPVTEMVTGVDLVEEQILVAAGNKLRLHQKEIHQKGHAIECRIYAEDPANGFLPSPGDMTLFSMPKGHNIRLDTSVETATTIHSFFDPMISKMIIWAPDREKARQDSMNALRAFNIHGIKTNISYLLGMLKHRAFESNTISTKFCDEHSDEILASIEAEAALLSKTDCVLAYTLYDMFSTKQKQHSSVWESIGYWRSIKKLSFTMDNDPFEVLIEEENSDSLSGTVNGQSFHCKVLKIGNQQIVFTNGDQQYEAHLSLDRKKNCWLSILGNTYQLQRTDILNMEEEVASGSASEDGNNLFAPMPGKVIKVNVKAGDQVKRGSILLVVEAMKMENNIIATTNAVVSKLTVSEGEMVDTDKQLVFLEPTEPK